MPKKRISLMSTAEIERRCLDLGRPSWRSLLSVTHALKAAILCEKKSEVKRR